MTGRARVAALLLLALLHAGCAWHLAPTVAPRVCADGLPPKVFVGESCPRGICGHTCEPGRWAPPEGAAR